MNIEENYKETKEAFFKLFKVMEYMQNKGVRITELTEHFDNEEPSVYGFLPGDEDSEFDFELTVRLINKEQPVMIQHPKSLKGKVNVKTN
jgi:hypothetical protein